MAKLTPSNKVKIFKQLNEREMPWRNSRFVIKEDEYDWLGNGNFSEVYVMEDVNCPGVEYAVKIIGFNEHRRIHQSDIESYKKEPILQYGLAKQCKTVVNIIDTEVLSLKLDGDGNVEDVRADDFGVEKPGWLVLVLIKMEKLAPIIEQNFTGDYSFKIPELKNANDKEILSLAINIAEALDASHGMRIMHRDVKLENIFFDNVAGIYKLGDFGIARITNQGSASTKGAGTLGYEAPEVEGGDDAKYSYQADIYSFGVTIYLLMNDLRFPGSTGYHVNRLVQYNPTAVIEEPLYGLQELKKLICSLLCYDPSERPKSMSDVLAGLDEIYQHYYGVGETQKIEKKQHKVREEVEIIKSNIDKTVSEVKQPQTDTKEHKTVVGKVVAEVNKETIEENKLSELSNRKRIISENKSDSDSPAKGIVGIVGIILGLLYFTILTRENLVLIKTPLVMWSLIADTIIAFYAIVLKFFGKKKMPYYVYFLLFCFSVYVMITSGMSWLYLIVSIALFIGGKTEIFAVLLSAWTYVFIMNAEIGTMVNSICNEKNAWIFFAIVLIGLIMAEQYDNQTDLFSIILANEMSPFMLGTLIFIVGIALWLVNLIPAISVASLLMNMHFIYVGLILWFFGAIIITIDNRRAG